MMAFTLILFTILALYYGIRRATYGSHSQTNGTNSDSLKIASLSGWYFFVLINAFYGGALTMFFVSLPTLPFDDVIGVLREYPDWKLIFLKVRTIQRFQIITNFYRYWKQSNEVDFMSKIP